MRYSKAILFACLLLMTVFTFAQQHQWAKSFENLGESFTISRDTNTLNTFLNENPCEKSNPVSQ